eukprot:TRINITY_DN10278_c0_g1_i1.p1 TRINITY_DN10278_c0_g1~~TRINITY_DN10278_c0_g1_i1.p1  ORF type:complete len:611 (-),score=114.42 TRINITY_DN10278_c0_g1_i1:137-1969(-)
MQRSKSVGAKCRRASFVDEDNSRASASDKVPKTGSGEEHVAEETSEGDTAALAPALSNTELCARERVPRSSRAGTSIPQGEWPRSSVLHRAELVQAGDQAPSAAAAAAVTSPRLPTTTTRRNFENELRLWRRRAHRRALRQVSTVRNGYALFPKGGSSDDASLTLPGSLSAHSEGLRSVAKPSVVRLHVYNLFGGSIGIGAFHAGVEIYGIEWSYGASCPDDPVVSGIYPCIPTTCPIGTYKDSVDLGFASAHDAQNVWHLLQFMAIQWLAKDYHFLEHNCLHFCSELTAYLNVEPPPPWVTRLPRAAAGVFSRLLSGLDLNCSRVSRVAVQRPEEEKRGGRRGAAQDSGSSSEEDEEDGSPAELSSEATACGDSEKRLKSRGSNTLSSTMSIALEFENDFRWANVCMVLFEGALTKGKSAFEGCSTEVQTMISDRVAANGMDAGASEADAPAAAAAGNSKTETSSAAARTDATCGAGPAAKVTGNQGGTAPAAGTSTGNGAAGAGVNGNGTGTGKAARLRCVHGATGSGTPVGAAAGYGTSGVRSGFGPGAVAGSRSRPDPSNGDSGAGAGTSAGTGPAVSAGGAGVAAGGGKKSGAVEEHADAGILDV